MSALNLYPLHESWVPPKLLVRDQQFNTLVANHQSSYSQNLLITGDKGLGKTLTAQMFSRLTPNTFIVDCVSPSFIKNIYNFAMKHGVKPTTYSSPVELIVQAVQSSIKNKSEKITIFFDDVDRLDGTVLKRDLSSYLASLYDVMQKQVENFSIHLITTKSLDYIEKKLTDWCLSRLKLQPLFFPRYTKKEIIMLLKQRLEFIDNLQIEEQAVEQIAEKVSRIGGDFRKALELTRTAITMNNALTVEGVEKAWEKEKTNFWKNQLLNIPFHAAMLLGCIVEETVKIHGEIKGDPPYFPVSWSRVKERYQRRCKDLNVLPQKDKMLYYWLEQLWLNGWIDKFTLSKKHEWNYTHIRELYIRLKEKLSNLVQPMKEINWSEPW